MARRRSRSRRLGARIASLLLSLLYYAIAANGLLFGGILTCNGWLKTDTDRGTGIVWMLGGVALIMLGLICFIVFPRYVRRWTGHEVVASPYT